MKEGFVVYKSFYQPIKRLTQTEKGDLLDAIFQYQIEGTAPILSPAIGMAFEFIKIQFDIDNLKYQAITERNRENGQKGGRPTEPKKPTGLTKTQQNPSSPKKADKDKDMDMDKDMDKDMDISSSKPSFDKALISKYMDDFNAFRNAYPGTKRGNPVEFSNFKKKNDLTVIQLLKPALDVEIKWRKKLRKAGQFVPQWKNLQTWINGRCWLQELQDVHGTSTSNLDNWTPNPEMR